MVFSAGQALPGCKHHDLLSEHAIAGISSGRGQDGRRNMWPFWNVDRGYQLGSHLRWSFIRDAELCFGHFLHDSGRRPGSAPIFPGTLRLLHELSDVPTRPEWINSSSPPFSTRLLPQRASC